MTIFSAPNYGGDFDNAGALLSVSESLMCSFEILKPGDKKLQMPNLSTFGYIASVKVLMSLRPYIVELVLFTFIHMKC